MGRFDLDARDAQWLVDAISGTAEIDCGPWRADSADRLLSDARAAGHELPYDPGQPGDELNPSAVTHVKGADNGVCAR